MKNTFLILVSLFCGSHLFSKELPIKDKEEILSFENLLIGIQHVEEKSASSFIVRQINLKCEEVKSVKMDVGAGKWTIGSIAMGNRFLVQAQNKKSGIGQVYMYDTTLTLIYQKSLTKEQQQELFKGNGSTEKKFDMADYYYRQWFMLSNILLLTDKFVDDGMLFLQFDESLMTTITGMAFGGLTKPVHDGSVRVYKLQWGKNEENIPLDFDVKWSVKLPEDSILGYKFYTYGKSTIFLYLVSIDGGQKRSFYYKLDPETGAVIQKIEVKLPNGSIPWVSSSHYDEQTDKLFIVGNYQNERGKDEMFGGYFIGVVNKDAVGNYILKPFPSMPAQPSVPLLDPVREKTLENYKQKDPMLIANHFTKNNSGSYTCTFSLTYSYTQTPSTPQTGIARRPNGGVTILTTNTYGLNRTIIMAAIVLVDFDSSLSQVNSRLLIFDRYEQSAPEYRTYGFHTAFQIMNRAAIPFEGMHPYVSDIPGTGVAEIICLNRNEGYNFISEDPSQIFYVSSTAPGSEFKKAFDFPAGGKNRIEGFFAGAPGEMIWRFHTKEKGSYLEKVKTHL